MLDVLLVSPNGFSYQLMLDKVFPRKYQYDYALCLLGTILQKNGFSAKIVDGFARELSPDKIIKLVVKNKPKIIGITTCAGTIKEVFKLAEKLKKLKTENNDFKELEIILGGQHITKMPHLLKELDIKYAILGDAENAILALCNHLINKDSIKNLSGIAEYLNGEIKINGIEVTQDIDNLPIQNLNLFVKEKEFKPEFLFIEASRGCPNNCYFCATIDYRKKVIYKSPQRIVEEIEELSKKYRTNFFIFTDGTFSSNKEHTLKICDLLCRKNIKIEWACSERIDSVDEELLREMKKAGCYAIFFGIESASKKIRNLCNKTFSEEKCIEIFNLCKTLGITPSGNFIIGHPGETTKDIEETLNFAMKLEDSEIFFKPLLILPNSTIYEQLVKEKKIDPNFYHKTKGDPVILNTFSGLSEEIIEKYVLKGYRKYYFTLKSIAKIFLINDLPTFYRALKFRWVILIHSIKYEIYYPLVNHFKKWRKK